MMDIAFGDIGLDWIGLGFVFGMRGEGIVRMRMRCDWWWAVIWYDIKYHRDIGSFWNSKKKEERREKKDMIKLSNFYF